MYTPVNLSFTVQKWGLGGFKSYRYVFVMFMVCSSFLEIKELMHVNICSYYSVKTYTGDSSEIPKKCCLFMVKQE